MIDPDFLISENKRLKHLVNELEDILESFYDGIGIIDGNGTLLRVNTSYERITGLSKKNNNVGRNVRELEEEGSVSRAVALMVLEQKNQLPSCSVSKPARKYSLPAVRFLTVKAKYTGLYVISGILMN